MSEAPVTKVAFLDSFPTHSIITRSHGTLYVGLPASVYPCALADLCLRLLPSSEPDEIELSPFLDTETQPLPSPLSEMSHLS